ncbi:MAG: hypothetical protein ACRDKT_08185 [Actinomycetota bacterium]
MIVHLAHVTSSSGNSIDQIVLAAGVLALGLAFLFQKNVKRSVSIMLVVFGVLGIVASLTVLRPGFLGETVTISGDEYPEEQLTDAAVGLCDSIEVADDIEEVRVLFLDRVHTALHVIAAGIEDDDRELSARLLRAKQVVEDELSGEDGALEDDLRALLAVTQEALVALDVEPPSC